MAETADDWSLGRLLSTAARLVEHEWNGWLAQHELTHAGFLALHSLEGGPLTQRQLAAASRVEEQTMSRVIERLERTGHVTRERDLADRRRLLVRRTPRGEHVHRELQQATVADRIVSETVSDPEAFRAELIRLVERFGSPEPDQAGSSPRT